MVLENKIVNQIILRKANEFLKAEHCNVRKGKIFF